MTDDSKSRLLEPGTLAEAPNPRMGLLEAIATRRTVRTYQERPVPWETLEELLLLSTHAPSACNRQGWKFVLVDSREDLDWLYSAGGSSVFRRAGQVLLACYVDTSDNVEWDDARQSAAAAITLFQLLAHTRGIGSCWLCHLPPRREVRARFSVPPEYMPVACLTVGYYRPGQKVKPRKLPEGPLLAPGRFRFDRAVSPGKGLAVLARRVARRLYYLVPRRGWLRAGAGRFEKTFHNEVCEDDTACGEDRK